MAKLVGFAGPAKRGELVYEPFLGSGTTLTAAELTERDDLLGCRNPADALDGVATARVPKPVKRAGASGNDGNASKRKNCSRDPCPIEAGCCWRTTDGVRPVGFLPEQGYPDGPTIQWYSRYELPQRLRRSHRDQIKQLSRFRLAAPSALS